MTVNVLITEHLSDAAAQWLADRATVQRCRQDEDGFADALAQAHGLIVRTYTQVNAALLDAAPSLQVVGRAGTGLDNIDLDACADRNITVVHTPDANRQAVVEYVLALMLHCTRPLLPMHDAVDVKAWGQLRTDAMAPWQLSELTLGILGCGRIGTRVAQVARAIGIETLCCDLVDLDLDQLHGARQVSMDTLLRDSDIISVHVDGRPENRNLLGESEFAAMKPEAILLNTSRGMVVDAAALATALHANTHMRAVLDVHDPEPIEAGHPLLGCPGALLLPHAASRTQAAQEAMSWVVRDVAAALNLPVD
ncbi:MAG: hypothetical protein MK074_05465 [Phycisphaerales bacterium]|nr:hypothetical protein [Phycisphaerales bacterium]